MRWLGKFAVAVAICWVLHPSARAESRLAPALGDAGYQSAGLVLAGPRHAAEPVARMRVASLSDRAAPEAARPIAPAPEQPRAFASPSSQRDRVAQPDFDGEWKVTSNVIESGRCRAADAFSFRIANGRLEGPKLSGQVDQTGTMRGVFRSQGAQSVLTGKFSAQTGSGSWSTSTGCHGKWAARRA
jgi:hypothetical protein